MKFLVTGASGFVGSAVLQALIARGHSVRAFVRPGSEGKVTPHAAVEIARGDLTDQESLARAVTDVDGVFHAAAIYAYWHSDPSQTYRTNVGGTEALLKAARSAGVGRAVFTSTVATLKWPGEGKLADESSVASLEDLPGHYKRSKLLAEQAALALNGPDFQVIAVNPTAPFGPGDARPSPTGRIVLEFLNRRFPGYVASGVNVCDVDDVAEGHVLAFEKGRPGERYILGGENMTLREIYDTLGQVTGLKRQPVRVPFAVAYAAGLLDALIEGKILRHEPFVPLEGLRVARHPLYVSCDKAVSELGLPQRPAAESLRRAAEWFGKNGRTRATMPSLTATEQREQTEARN